jgi:hypothetical protein
MPGDVGIVPQHPGADVTDHRLDYSDGDPQFDHVGDEGVPEVMKPEALQSGGPRKALPGTIPVFFGADRDRNLAGLCQHRRLFVTDLLASGNAQVSLLRAN